MDKVNKKISVQTIGILAFVFSLIPGVILLITGICLKVLKEYVKIEKTGTTLIVLGAIVLGFVLIGLFIKLITFLKYRKSSEADVMMANENPENLSLSNIFFIWLNPKLAWKMGYVPNTVFPLYIENKKVVEYGKKKED